MEETAVVGRALAAQCLLRPATTVEEVLRRTAGLSGANPSGYLSLAVRMEAFEPTALDLAIEEKRTVVRVPAMRGSLYLLPTDHAADGLALAKPAQFRPSLQRAGLDAETSDTLARSVESILAGSLKTGGEIRRALGSEEGAKNLPSELFTFFLRAMSHEGRLLRVGSRGGPRSQMFRYALADEWLGEALRMPDESEGLVRLLPGYLQAHGPSSLTDVAWWAGVSAKVARSAWNASMRGHCVSLAWRRRSTSRRRR